MRFNVKAHGRNFFHRVAFLFCSFQYALILNILSISAYADTPSLQDISLQSGISLSDWIALPSAKENIPSFDTAKQAAIYIRNYGPYRELLDIVYRATQNPDYEKSTVNEYNAKDKLAELAVARRALGDWPNLTMGYAYAAAYSGDTKKTTEALKQWLVVVSPNHPQRNQIVALLVRQERDGVAVLEIATAATAMKKAHAANVLVQVQAGNPDAMDEYAALLESGDGVAKNPTEAQSWRLKARDAHQQQVQQQQQDQLAAKQSRIENFEFFPGTTSALSMLNDSDPLSSTFVGLPFALLGVIVTFPTEILLLPFKTSDLNAIKNEAAYGPASWAKPDSMIAKAARQQNIRVLPVDLAAQ